MSQSEVTQAIEIARTLTYPHLPYMPLRKDLEMLLFAHWAEYLRKS